MENLRFLNPFDERFHKSKDAVPLGSLSEFRSSAVKQPLKASLKTQLLFDNWNKSNKKIATDNESDKIIKTLTERNSNDFLIYLSFGLFILFIIYCVFNTGKDEFIQSIDNVVATNI